MPVPADREEALRYLHEIVIAFVGSDDAMLVRDLSFRQLAILLSVRFDKPAYTMSGLARRVGVNKAAVSRALNAFQQQGILIREEDVSDRRRLKVHCTDKGRQFVDRLAEITRKFYARTKS